MLPTELVKALEVLGAAKLFQETFSQKFASPELAEAAVTSFKKEVDALFKQAAFTAHPDRGGSVEQMQQLNTARDILNKIEVRRPRPITVLHIFANSINGATTATSTFGGSFWG